ncbi:MAG: PIN domain-containing protein [Desulfobacterales bacterium]|nr:PIN domain-containing protein [Desulfobacterales bacterium]
MDRLFLDANILFSAAYREGAGVTRLWQLNDTELVTSAYALEEARRNLPGRGQRKRLSSLITEVTIITVQPLNHDLPPDISLPEKDRPILLAAIHARATHLITGDVQHFGRYYDKIVEGVVVLPPAAYLADR